MCVGVDQLSLPPRDKPSASLNCSDSLTNCSRFCRDRASCLGGACIAQYVQLVHKMPHSKLIEEIVLEQAIVPSVR